MAKRKPIWQNVGLLRKTCDRLWSKAVLADAAGKCAMCGQKATDAHHLVPRQFYATRHSLMNGLALCHHCHVWDRNQAPHQHAASFMAWLTSYYPLRAEWYIQNRRPAFEGTKNAAYYISVIRGLQQYVEPQEFEAICGIRFSEYLLRESDTP